MPSLSLAGVAERSHWYDAGYREIWLRSLADLAHLIVPSLDGLSFSSNKEHIFRLQKFSKYFSYVL